MARRTFTIEFKDQACALVMKSGYTPAKAARELGGGGDDFAELAVGPGLAWAAAAAMSG